MKSITLKEFKDMYYPKLTKQKFAEVMGITNSLMSKMLNGKYDCSLKSATWMNLCKYIRDNYNLQLISESKFVIEGEKASKIIRNLQMEIQSKDRIIAEYEKTIQELLSSVRVMVGAKEALMKGEFTLSQNRRKTK